jgi:hypothetical protein
MSNQVNYKLAESFAKGTQARAKTASISRHAWKATWTLSILSIILWLIFVVVPNVGSMGGFADRASVHQDQSTAQTSTHKSSKSATTAKNASWAVYEKDGSIPVGVWSESYMPPPGSKTFYDSGNGSVYRIRYRLYKNEWTIHPGGNNYPPANEIQFMALKPGLNEIQFSVRYPNGN